MNMIDKISGLSKVAGAYAGIISRRPLNQLKKLFTQRLLILAGSGGCEIDSLQFSWTLPQISTIQQHIENIFQLIKMEIGPAWTQKNAELLGVELNITVNPENLLISRQIQQLLRQALQETLLRATWHQNSICVYPKTQFNKQMAVHKIIELLPGVSGQAPVVCYFGAELSDEPAFREANLHGYSILLRENIGRKTAAQYYLRNANELNKTLIWLNSL